MERPHCAPQRHRLDGRRFRPVSRYLGTGLTLSAPPPAARDHPARLPHEAAAPGLRDAIHPVRIGTDRRPDRAPVVGLILVGVFPDQTVGPKQRYQQYAERVMSLMAYSTGAARLWWYY